MSLSAHPLVLWPKLILIVLCFPNNKLLFQSIKCQHDIYHGLLGKPWALESLRHGLEFQLNHSVAV